MERIALECTGFNVELAPNGRAALDALSELQPCVILLDLMMPVMGGLDFLKNRQSKPALSKIPVICISAAGSRMVSEALQLGAQECLTKPADVDLICERVRVLCRGN